MYNDTIARTFLRGLGMMRITAMGDRASQHAFRSAVEELMKAGFFVSEYRPDGHGREMEKRIRSRERDTISGVFDFSPVELLTGAAGPDRMTAAGELGIPQLISVAGLDFHPVENRPTTDEERDALGKMIVERACAAKGPTAVAIPIRGFHGEGDNPLFQSIRNWVYPPHLLVELDFALSDAAFGIECCQLLLNLIRQVS
jgi:uncharacterized protein (UPF0261 family)